MGYGGGEPSDSGRELGSECGSVGVAGVLVLTDVGETARSDVYDVVHALNPRAGGWESLGHPSVWSASKGLRRADGTHESFPFERGRRLRRSGQTFHYSGAARSMRNGRADEHDDRISTEHSEFQETSIGSDGRGHLHDSDGSKMLNTILTVLGSSRGRTTRRILSGWWGGSMEGHTCALLNTCEESRQMKWIAWVWMKADRRTSCWTTRIQHFRRGYRHQRKFPQNHQKNSKTRFAMTWTSTWTHDVSCAFQ